MERGYDASKYEEPGYDPFHADLDYNFISTEGFDTCNSLVMHNKMTNVQEEIVLTSSDLLFISSHLSITNNCFTIIPENSVRLYTFFSALFRSEVKESAEILLKLDFQQNLCFVSGHVLNLKLGNHYLYNEYINDPFFEQEGVPYNEKFEMPDNLFLTDNFINSDYIESLSKLTKDGLVLLYKGNFQLSFLSRCEFWELICQRYTNSLPYIQENGKSEKVDYAILSNPSYTNIPINFDKIVDIVIAHLKNEDNNNMCNDLIPSNSLIDDNTKSEFNNFFYEISDLQNFNNRFDFFRLKGFCCHTFYEKNLFAPTFGSKILNFFGDFFSSIAGWLG